MTIRQMIAEFRKGCSNTIAHPGVAKMPPESCPECVAALLKAIEGNPASAANVDAVLTMAGEMKETSEADRDKLYGLSWCDEVAAWAADIFKACGK